MSKIKVFLKQDGQTVSSLKVEGMQRRLVKPIPSKSKWVGQRTLYVNPCEVHDDQSPTVPLEAFMFDPTIEGGKPVGVKRFCILCWQPVEKVLKKD